MVAVNTCGAKVTFSLTLNVKGHVPALFYLADPDTGRCQQATHKPRPGRPPLRSVLRYAQRPQRSSWHRSLDSGATCRVAVGFRPDTPTLTSWLKERAWKGDRVEGVVTVYGFSQEDAVPVTGSVSLSGGIGDWGVEDDRIAPNGPWLRRKLRGLGTTLRRVLLRDKLHGPLRLGRFRSAVPGWLRLKLTTRARGKLVTVGRTAVWVSEDGPRYVRVSLRPRAKRLLGRKSPPVRVMARLKFRPHGWNRTYRHSRLVRLR
jgi:hypothetical protein